ncbi:MAG: hypothetical protein ABW000_20270 [Actinoplanes sp.]
MAAVARILPRFWDGRRLLQFLTGLALIAVAFAVPALAGPPASAPPPATVTTVDAPAVGEATQTGGEATQTGEVGAENPAGSIADRVWVSDGVPAESPVASAGVAVLDGISRPAYSERGPPGV